MWALVVGVPISLSEEEDEDKVVLEPSRKRCKLASEIALRERLQSGLYPEFVGPVESHSQDLNSALDYLKLLWSNALTSVIADETNTYSKWIDITTDDVWPFFIFLS